jgi:hypothetical protein
LWAADGQQRLAHRGHRQFNGGGKTDILLRSDSGAVATWDMDDHSFTLAVIATGPNDWHIL